MRTHSNSIIWLTALLLLSLVAGCGDPDKNGGGGGAISPATPPTVTFVTPPNGNVGVCPNTAIISATFSKPMNPATITTSTFTLKGPGGVSVAGSVNYVVATQIATFTPTTPLALNTTYTATITTGVTDTFGNTLATNFVWSFTTPLGPCTPAPIIILGTACNFGILGATPNVNNTGPTIVTGGDVGVWPAVAIIGFPPGTIVGGIKQPGNAVAMTAQGNLTTAYNQAGTVAGGTFGLGTGTGAVLTADIGGQTLAPGVYRTTSAQPSLGITGNLTLDGGGDPNSVWVFQIGSTLTTAAGNSKIILQNGATANHVFWQVGSSATLGVNTPGTATIFQGTIMANITITLGTGAILDGRALARTGTINMDSNPVNVPLPCI